MSCACWYQSVSRSSIFSSVPRPSSLKWGSALSSTPSTRRVLCIGADVVTGFRQLLLSRYQSIWRPLRNSRQNSRPSKVQAWAKETKQTLRSAKQCLRADYKVRLRNSLIRTNKRADIRWCPLYTGILYSKRGNKITWTFRNTLLLSINGNCMEFCFIYMVWWFFETKAFCALPEKGKIGKLQRLKMGLGMSNIELK